MVGEPTVPQAQQDGEVRVLVIDDDADSREVTAAFLRSSGFVVDEFETAEEALARAIGVDAVVTDITLPGMSGYELASRLRADPRTSGVILYALSGRSDASPEQARLFDRIVVKPFDPDALVSALEASTGYRVVQAAPGPMATSAASFSEPSGSIDYRLLVERAPALVWQSGTDAQCMYFNETWLSFTGRPEHEELGDGWIESLHPDDVRRCLEARQWNFERRVPFELEYRLRRHDGVYRSMTERGAPMVDDAGKFMGFVGNVFDIEEHARADRAKGRFLATMAHEFRTPLTPLRAYQQQIERTQARGEPISADLMTRFARQVDRIAALVEHLGDAARLSANLTMTLGRDKCDLSDVVRRVVAKYAALLAARRDVAKTPTIDSHGLEQAAPVLGDPKRLEQMVNALLDNAVKFSEGNPVKVTLSTEGGAHRLTIEDQGIGIPHGELGGAGTLYFRASNASVDHYPGGGLGLALAKEIATVHGGSLSLQANHGVTATVIVPAHA